MINLLIALNLLSVVILYFLVQYNKFKEETRKITYPFLRKQYQEESFTLFELLKTLNLTKTSLLRKKAIFDRLKRLEKNNYLKSNNSSFQIIINQSNDEYYDYYLKENNFSPK